MQILTYLNDALVFINHFPSPPLLLYITMMIKNVLRPTIMMICDVSSRQYQFEALLVPEQIVNIERRVGMCSLERREGPDPDLSPGCGRYGDR